MHLPHAPIGFNNLGPAGDWHEFRQVGQVSSFYCKIVSMSYSSITGSALDLLLLLELEFDDDDDDVDDVPDFEISISF